MKLASIIICCYNSRERIKPTLEHISFQKGIAKETIEVILVDNNSTDGTERIASEYWSSLNSDISFQVVMEPKPGLSNARKKGVNAARGKYIIFCDDDNWLNSDYVSVAIEIMEKNNKIGVLGGVGIPVLGDIKPYWFDRFQKYFALGPQAPQNGDVTYTKGYVYGAGSIMRKIALEKLYRSGFLNLLSDRKENILNSGGDNELCYNIIFLGYEIHYCDKLIFSHFIPAPRLTLDYFKKFRIGQAQSYDVVKSYETILFSKGAQRRNGQIRRAEYRKMLYEIYLLLKKKKRGKVDNADFIFLYFNLIHVIKSGVLNWKVNVEKEKQIFQVYKNSMAAKFF